MATRKRTEAGPRIVAVVNQKGGCGKTTVAMQLAGTWARDGKRQVLVVDADPQGTATRWSASAPDEGFPATVVGLAASGRELHREVLKLAPKYDLVVIDCPPAVDMPHPKSALSIADLAIIPVIPSPPDIWAAVGIRDLINAVAGDDLVPRLLLNMVQPNTTLAKEAEAALKDFGIPIMETTLGLRQSFRQSAVYGSTVHDMKDARATDEVEALAKEALRLMRVKP